MRKVLILLTNIYPYGYGESFLETELFFVSKSFEKIILLPFRKSSHIRHLPKNVEVCDILSKDKKIIFFLKYFPEVIFSNDVWQEVSSLPFKQRILCFINVILFKCKSSYIKKSIEDYVQYNNLKYSEIVFYTYWLASGTYAIGLLKLEQPEIKLVSRAHGFDIYAERWFCNYIPFQLENIKRIDKLYLISRDGYQYLANKYPNEEFAIIDKMQISRLGVNKSSPIVKAYKSFSIFKILTCSNFGQVKRLDILIEALVILDNMDLVKRIEWTHIGGKKPLWSLNHKNYQEMAIRKLKNNIDIKFLGILPHDDILKIYQNKWFDLFINVSDSEGIPVSIMESLSSGIPVIARNVGGISEIVNNNNGWLLDANISPEKLAETLLIVISSKNELLKKRQAAVGSWEAKFNADLNYNQFVDSLVHL